MKKKIRFDEDWGEFFANHGLETFDDFFERFDKDYEGEQTLSKKSKADVQMLDFGSENIFFIKRFFYPGYKNILRAWSAFGEPTTHGRLEWENAKLLLNNGIGACRPVCYGEGTVCGLEARSFVVTEKLRTTPLESFIVHRWKGLERKSQEKLVFELAKMVRRIHNLNVSMRDLYVRHVYIDEKAFDNGVCRFSFLDLENMARGVKSAVRKGRDMGRLYYSMAEEYFDKDIKLFLVDTYVADDPDRAKKLRRIILARATEMSKRRKLLEYVP